MGNIIRLFLPKQEPVLVGDNDSYISGYSAEKGFSSVVSSRRSTDEPASSLALSSEPEINTDGSMFIPKKRKQSKSSKRKRRKKYF